MSLDANGVIFDLSAQPFITYSKSSDGVQDIFTLNQDIDIGNLSVYNNDGNLYGTTSSPRFIIGMRQVFDANNKKITLPQYYYSYYGLFYISDE
jgi:hypothetical protein